MNEIDVALVVLLLICALRGFWRGFFRESCGFFSLIIGIVAALRYAEAGAALLATRIELSDLPATVRLGIAFVGIFAVVNTAGTILGFLCDRLFGSGARRRVTRVGGAVFGLGKGGAVLAFVLLFFYLFPVLPGLDRQIMDSQIARPMVAAASAVLRVGWQGAAPGAPRA